MFSTGNTLLSAVLDRAQQLGHCMLCRPLLLLFRSVVSLVLTFFTVLGAKGWFYITTDYQPGCSWAVPRLEEKQPTISCSSDANADVTCPADSQCCCSKHSIFKKT